MNIMTMQLVTLYCISEKFSESIYCVPSPETSCKVTHMLFLNNCFTEFYLLLVFLNFDQTEKGKVRK